MCVSLSLNEEVVGGWDGRTEKEEEVLYWIAISVPLWPSEKREEEVG